MIASPNQFDFEIPDEPLPVDRPKHQISDDFWNRFTLFFLAATLIVIALVAWIFFNPTAGINPYPPISIPPTVVIPTSTATIQPSATFPPTVTKRATLTPFPSNTPRPAELVLSPTVMFILPSVDPYAETLDPTQKAISGSYSYAVQPGSPASISSAIMRPDDGCNWMGVGGQVVDLQGAPIVGLRVQLYGSLHGKVKAITSLTGTVNRYGPAGYEITIADAPTDTYHTLWLQLFNQSGGAISDKVYFNTSSDCEKNLTIIHFKQVK